MDLPGFFADEEMEPRHISRPAPQARRHIYEFVFRYNRRFYRHVSFETLLGLAADHEPASYWDIIKRDNPRKGAEPPAPLHTDEPESTG